MLNLSVSFYWKPYVNESYFQTLNYWLENPMEMPSVILAGKCILLYNFNIYFCVYFASIFLLGIVPWSVTRRVGEVDYLTGNAEELITIYNKFNTIYGVEIMWLEPFEIFIEQPKFRNYMYLHWSFAPYFYRFAKATSKIMQVKLYHYVIRADSILYLKPLTKKLS